MASIITENFIRKLDKKACKPLQIYREEEGN
jgi:hypothetical protein